jgi:hypothetical protein
MAIKKENIGSNFVINNLSSLSDQHDKTVAQVPFFLNAKGSLTLRNRIKPYGTTRGSDVSKLIFGFSASAAAAISDIFASPDFFTEATFQSPYWTIDIFDNSEFYAQTNFEHTYWTRTVDPDLLPLIDTMDPSASADFSGDVTFEHTYWTRTVDPDLLPLIDTMDPSASADFCAEATFESGWDGT